MDSLVVTKSYDTRQQPPIDAIGSGAIAGKENTSTFADRNEETVLQKAVQVPPERIPDLFRDKRVEEWRASEADSSGEALRIIRDRLKTVTTWIPTN